MVHFGENLDTLKQIKNEQIVAVDLNDARQKSTGINKSTVSENYQRATGVIDVKTFLQFLVDVGLRRPCTSRTF